MAKVKAFPSVQELSDIGLDPKRMPDHIAVIMDGNGRWAKKRLLPRKAGHKQGAEALRKTIKACAQLGIHYLTVYAFSTENWKRPEEEVQFLMGFFNELIHKETPELKKQGAKVRVLGHVDALPKSLQDNIKQVEAETASGMQLQVNIMMNYGSRLEIIHAAKKMAADLAQNPKLDISEEQFHKYLYSHDSPDPDILIRTGGDHRISNYLLWQIAYSELFFIDSLWPDFDKDTLHHILRAFQKRDRRFGGLNDA